MYSKKGPKTILLSVGNSASCMADLELAELLGCPLRVVPLSDDQRAQWDEVAGIIKTRVRDANAKYDFSKGADTRWILSRNLVIHSGPAPSFSNPLFPWVEAMCSSTEARIDILKLDMKNGDEKAFLYATLDAGFRPGCIIVTWTDAPDASDSTAIAAGHLQMCGYTLLDMIGKKALYHYNGDDMYLTCSWEDRTCKNPLVKEIITFTKKSLATAEASPNNVTRNIPPSGEAAAANSIEEAPAQPPSVQ
jgi:hypothetical protein